MINAIAIDDEPRALRIIEKFAPKTGIVNLLKTFVEPKEALYYVSNFPVDLIFLDIQMPSVSGIEFIKKSEQKTLIIFTTAFSAYAVAGFNLNAVDFLLKPFTYERFYEACQKAQTILNKQIQSNYNNQNVFYIRSNYSLVKIHFNEIELIEGLDDYVKIHLEAKEAVLARMTMRNMIEKLPKDDFIRVHRSFIVPVKKINKLRKNQIVVMDREIPIGISYKETINKLLENTF